MIFLDNASTTKVDKQILDDFVSFSQDFYNPSANYTPSTLLSQKIEKSRENLVKMLNGDTLGTFVFTASSSEANNIVLNSLVSNNKNEEYVFSSLEHPSVYNFASNLLNSGRKVSFANSLPSGEVDEKHLLSLINSNTKFVFLIHVCNETGAINKINELCDKIKSINPKTLVCADGVQALGKIKVDCSNLDFYTISSHKIHGIKGIAGFYAKNLKLLKPFILGGGQEFNIRSGTTNAPAIFCLENTIKNALNSREENYNKVKSLNLLLKNKLNSIEDIVINSGEYNFSPYILSFSVLGLNAETLQNALNLEEIYVGLGSACSSKKSGNRILESMNKSKTEILGNLRISFSKHTTEEEVEIFFEKLKNIFYKLREKLK